MNEIVLNQPTTILVSASDNSALTDLSLFLGADFASEATSFVRVGVSNVWAVAFTPVSTGVYSVYAFGRIQEKLLCVTKTLRDSVRDIEDEALGSWTWDKALGILILMRQNGTELTRFEVTDNNLSASREKLP